MPNKIKFTTGTVPGSLAKGNARISTGEAVGPTHKSGFFNGITPPVNGYTFYIKKTGGIVEDGLVFAIDPGHYSSYRPDLGLNQIWDISGNGNDSLFSNGTYYNSDNDGNLVFDGIDDYIDFYAPNITTIATVEMWVKIGTGYSGKMFMGWTSYDVYCQGGAIGYNTANSDCYGITQTTVASLGCVNNWKHYIFEMNSGVSITNNKIYINGVSQSLSQIYSTPSTRSINGQGRIASWKNGGYYMPMNMCSFRIYNRALSQAEILQNFNAEKSRFGL